MAAPGRKKMSRSFVQLLCHFNRTAVSSEGCRHFSITSVSRATPQPKDVTWRVGSPWTLMAAVCLQRLPVISADCNPLEQRFKNLMQQVELEKSLLSDHELQLLEDAERMRRKQAADYDSDEEGGRDDQDIVLAQDLEDNWEQKLRSFQPAPRVRADVDKDLTSVERCLAEPLLLLTKQQVGDEKLWLLPQAPWQAGETLRQTAERALTTVTAGTHTHTLSNAPCGVYKYKLPNASRTESSVAHTHTHFKALLEDRSTHTHTSMPLVWVKRHTHTHNLKPNYKMKAHTHTHSL
ncbi:transcript variant X2 [Nothobranchius furzeri]|uniref:Transcript variant X2 n=1 Tax=Nothobranchius furzeri TaxID=105023 RepID=A0A9D2Y2K8_NOTFU|nr:transcript variant X2 [Nothobranchius furzeri]